MKALIFVFCSGLLTLYTAMAFAWSPLNGVESVVNSMSHCFFLGTSETTVQADENTTEIDDEEEEEEPDCD